MRRLSRVYPLLFNHADAWGITFIIICVLYLLHDAFSVRHIGLLLAVTLAYWFGFAVNDYYDAPYDAHDPHKARRNYFVQHTLAPIQVWRIVLVVLSPVALIFASYGRRGMAFFCLSVGVLWAYSAPPLRLKSRPVLDLVTHALFVETYPYVLVHILLDLPWLAIDILLIAFLMCASLAAQLEQQARDYALDAATDNNFTVTFGKPVTLLLLKLVSLGLIVVGVGGISLGVVPLFLLPLFALGTPAVVHRFWRAPDTPRPEHLIKLSIALGVVYMLGVVAYGWWV